MSQTAADHIVYEPLLTPAASAGNMPGSPPVGIRELPDKYIVLADLPGVEPAAVEITFTSRGDTLVRSSRRPCSSRGSP